ncbi:unnamed protein product [Camellia sinensis]
MERVNNCNLIDLGSSGPCMTWTNNSHGITNTMEILDRAICNVEGRTMFPEGTAKVLPITYSDHSLFVVYTQGKRKLNTDGCSRENETRIWIWQARQQHKPINRAIGNL